MPVQCYKPSKLGDVMVGIENELRVGSLATRRKLSETASKTSYVRAGSDCSLNHNDIEFRTEPRPYNRRNMGVFANFFDRHKERAIQAPDTCRDTCRGTWNGVSYGMHVNVSWFRDTTYDRVQAFVVNNRRVIEQLAGRDSVYYCRYEILGRIHKYCCVHIRSNGVCEFRIFKATTDKVAMKMRIQFCVAVCKFCDEADLVYSWDNFKTFVARSKKSHPELASYLGV